MESVRLNDYSLKFLLIVVLISLIIKLVFSSQYLAIFFISLFEFIIFYFLLIFVYSKKNKFRKVLYYGILFVMSLVSFVQSIYLDESILRKESFYGVDSAYAKFFFGGIMQIDHYFMVLAGIILMFLIPKFIKLPNYNFKFKKIFVFFGLFLVLGLPQLSYSYFDNIYVNTVAQTYENNFAQRLPSVLINNNVSEFEIFENSIKNYSKIELKNETGRVLVFVMESVPFNYFINEQKNIREDRNSENFFDLIKNNSHLYSNYYTNNQDSRTSIMTILSSTFIPFEAYTSFYDWKPYFGYIENRNNLVEFFNLNNFKTSFVISSTEKTLESEIYPYKEIINIKNFSTSNENFLCLHLFVFQHGCEDKYLIEDVKDSIRSNDKLFMIQEFVYGHGVVYNKNLGKTNFEYYNEYLTEIYNFLKEENLLENTTIVVTSDHGLREMVPRRRISGYNIPLVIYNSKIEEFKESSELLSHVKFKDILLSYIAENFSYVPSEKVYFVGPTSKSLLGIISDKFSSIIKIQDEFDQLIYLNKNFNESLNNISNEFGLVKFYKKKVN